MILWIPRQTGQFGDTPPKWSFWGPPNLKFGAFVFSQSFTAEDNIRPPNQQQHLYSTSSSNLMTSNNTVSLYTCEYQRQWWRSMSAGQEKRLTSEDIEDGRKKLIQTSKIGSFQCLQSSQCLFALSTYRDLCVDACINFLNRNKISSFRPNQRTHRSYLINKKI